MITDWRNVWAEHTGVTDKMFPFGVTQVISNKEIDGFHATRA